MWPTHIQGPRAVSLIANIPVVCSSQKGRTASHKWNFVIFGETHGNLNCDANARDVWRTPTDEYVMIDGEAVNDRVWTIGRLMVHMANEVNKNPKGRKVDYLIEASFDARDPRTPLSPANDMMNRLRNLFAPCLSRDKSACSILPHVFVHAIDYRSIMSDHVLDVEALDLETVRDFITAVLGDNYDLIQDKIPQDAFNYYRSLLSPIKPVSTQFSPIDFFTACSFVFMPYYEHPLSTASSNLLIKTISAVFGSEFKVTDLLLLYLTYDTPAYIEWIKQRYDILSGLLPLWDDLLLHGLLPNATEYTIMIMVMHLFRRFHSECGFIARGKHKSVKERNGILVSRASLQLLKARDCYMEYEGKKISIQAFLLQWISFKRFDLSIGHVWQSEFRNRVPSKLFVFQMINEGAFFMDVPAIARAFQRDSHLTVAYLGETHRRNWQDFFEFCRLSSVTIMARPGDCLALPKAIQNVFQHVAGH